MRIVLTGLSHKTAPVQLREKLSLYGRSPEEQLHSLRDAVGLAECAVLSTCNRTEIYGFTDEEDWQERILEHLSRQAGVGPGQLQEHLYSFEGTPAVRHLFRVAGGLDSMVVGEGQILGQVKETLQTAQEAGVAGTVVHTLFQHAIGSGKRARTETEIGRGAVSISFAAVQLAKQVFPRLAGHTVLLLGAGETGEQTARLLLAEQHPPALMICNRTAERAAALVAEIGGTAIPYDHLGEALVRADLVISSTGAPHPIVGVDLMRRTLRTRRGRPLLLVDIAVPRDVEAGVADLDDVYLYNIDDLQEKVAQSLQGRQAEVARVEELIEADLLKFQTWLRGLEVGPTIRQLQELAQAIVAGEQERVGGRLSHLSQRDREVVDTLVTGIVNKLLRAPILHLKEAAGSGNGYHEVEHVRAIFGLRGASQASVAEPDATEEENA